MSDRLKTFDHIGIVVQDLEVSIAWYAKHLGFERQSKFDFPGAQVAFIRRGSLRLELFQIEGAAPLAAERKQAESNLTIGGINHFAIVVDDLDETVAELQANGVELAYTLNDVPDGSGDRWTFVRDNEGMLIELYEPAR